MLASSPGIHWNTLRRLIVEEMESLMHMISHRQRLRTALDHQEPDKVPLDFGTGGNTSPAPEVYRTLCALLGVPYELRLVPHIMRLAIPDERVLQALDIDTRPVYMNPVVTHIRPCDRAGYYYDEWGVLWHEYDLGGVIYREIAENPLRSASLEDLEHYPWWPDPLDPVRYAGIREHALQIYHTTDYALIGCPAFNSVWERAYFLCGFERMLEGLLTEPDFVHAVFRKITDVVLASLGIYLDLVGEMIEVVKIGDDLGGQENCLISPTTYRRTIKPYHQEIFGFIHTHSRARAFLHTCGSVVKLLPDLIEAGVEILNPVQVSARGMDTLALKAQFGEQLTFWGAIDTQHVLPHGSLQEVEAEVRRRITDLAPGGGYVLASVHNIQADVPADNVVGMFKVARQFGSYPIRLDSQARRG
jgi:uroporphyrinogen decarboxylase